MRRVISYSFFRHKDSAYEQPEAGEGRGRFFLGFLPALLRSHFSVWPDWELHIHHDQAVTVYPYFEVLNKLWMRSMDGKPGPKIILERAEHTAKRLCESMLWRMKSIWWYDQPDVVLCRDIDSLETPRSRKAVERWLKTGIPMHVIHDSVSHSGVMGGTCGFRTKEIREKLKCYDWAECVKNFDLSKLGSDQRLLSEVFASTEKHIDNTVTLGPMSDPRDKCDGFARGVGGAYHAGPVAEWYDEHHPGLTEIIRKAEKEAGV